MSVRPEGASGQERPGRDAGLWRRVGRKDSFTNIAALSVPWHRSFNADII